MIDQVNEILKNDVEAVIKSPLSLTLLRCYSTLYLNGRQPRACAASQRKYYSQLKKDGMSKARKLEMAKERTCKPNWNGLCYSSKACKHFSNETITDGEAIDALNKGYLFESQFDVLPENYKKKSNSKKNPKTAK